LRVDGDLKYKLIERKKNLKELTYLFGACLPLIRTDNVPWLRGDRSITDGIFLTPVLNYEMKEQATLT